MKVSRVLAWVLFFLYAIWGAALQGMLASPRRLGEWTPDLGLVLLFAWAALLYGGRGGIAALLVALARAAFGADPPVVLASASLAAIGVFAWLRTIFEVDRALPRALLCGLCALFAARFLVGAREFALAAEAPGVELEPALGARLWPGALATALACLVLAPIARRLPGLANLRRTRP